MLDLIVLGLPLRFFNLGRRHLFSQFLFGLRRLGVALDIGQRVPEISPHIIRFYPLPFLVHDAQIDLSLGQALFGCFLVPGHGLGVVLRQTLALVIEHAKVELGEGVALLGQWPDNGDFSRVIAALMGALGPIPIAFAGPD